MSNILEKHEQNRTQILLVEIGAYLHIIGRFTEKFINAQAKDSQVSYKYQNICDNRNFFEGTGLDVLLKDNIWSSLLNSFTDLNNPGKLETNKVNNFCDFIKKHTWSKNQPEEGLCRILADAHGIVSGIDKGLAGMGDKGKQRKEYTFKANAFGYEEEIELLKDPGLKKELLCKLKEIIERIKQNGNISFEDYQDLSSTFKKYYPKTIGETRRPINEITLYDYAYSIASLTKSNLAKIIIDGWYDPKGQSKWRILRINIDVLGLLSKGLKIGDILGYKKEIDEVFSAIRKIIEYDYPIGNEIYRDSTGIYFSCPNLKDINGLLKELKEKLKQLNVLDFVFQVNISEEESRSMVVLANDREKSLKEIVFPQLNDIGNIVSEFEKSKQTGNEICQVCRIRLKPEKDDRCEKCKERYQKRALEWIENPKNTIWLDEVADKNDRLALILGAFELKNWLNGNLIDTFLSQRFEEWEKENNNNRICQQLNIQSIGHLENIFKSLFNGANLSNDYKKLIESFVGYKPNNFIQDFWYPIAERDATGKALEISDSSEKAKHLIKLLFRKHPSFARIRRCWETTHEFITETVYDEILKNYNRRDNIRTRRIQFKISPNPEIPISATCDIDIDGVRFSPVCIDKDQGLFVTTINLQILGNKEKSIDEIIKWMNGKEIKLKKEVNIWLNKKFRIIDAKPANDKYQNYLPFIKIYDFPDQFMVLVPAYDAFDIAKKIFEEYEVQFSKVRDRLPLHLGIIAFHRRTPLYVAMDAGKRLIDAFRRKSNSLKAKVISITNDDQLKKHKILTFKPEDENYTSDYITWKISYATGDPEQEDNWHPYIRVENPELICRETCSFDYTGQNNYVIHVKKLKEEDTILFEPAYFKMIFLENNADRFRVDENLRPLDDIRKLDELWKDIEDIVKKKGIGIAQIYAFWQETEKRRKDYGTDSIWGNFVKTCITNILKIKENFEQELFNRIFYSTKTGLLDLCLNWNLQVRKIKPGKKEE